LENAAMSIDPREAESSLQDVARIEQRMREAFYYGGSSSILIVWGVVWAVGYLVTYLSPPNANLAWYVLDGFGVLSAVAIGYTRSRARRRDWDWRLSAAFVLLMGFGIFWASLLGNAQWREISVFWSTLFMFGYILAGLWLGRFFIVCGVAVTLLTLAGYFWSGPWFPLWMAVVGGGSLMLGGLWLRRVGARG
jgi:hypothetical protein